MADSGTPLISDVFRPYEKLVEISILGKTFLVPERNSLLRAFQFISPETIPYGRFCWMSISNLAPELVGCLRTKLGKVAQSSETLSEVPAVPTAPRDEDSH